MKARGSLYLSAVVLLTILVAAVGCSKAPTEAQITSDIQNKLNTGSALQGKQLVVQAADGSVTLSGQVDNYAQRDAAARYASNEPGVKQVVNNLQVGPPTEAQNAPAPSKPSPAARRTRKANRDKDKEQSDSDNPPAEVAQTAPAPAPVPAPAAPTPPPPPPPSQKVTIASGT